MNTHTKAKKDNKIQVTVGLTLTFGHELSEGQIVQNGSACADLFYAVNFTPNPNKISLLTPELRKQFTIPGGYKTPQH